MKTNVLLWTIQVLLALLFAFAGGVKLVLPIEPMASQTSLPGPFLRFIGSVELLGAIGVVVPALLRIRPMLTPIAAAGLVVVMIGATTVTVRTMGIGPAVFPLAVGMLAAFVVVGRTSLAPIAPRRPSSPGERQAHVARS